MNTETQEKIYVTKSFMPLKEEYFNYLNQIYQNRQLTNQGPMLNELENKLSSFLQVKNFHYITNGTIALQIALKSLEIEDGEIIQHLFLM